MTSLNRSSSGAPLPRSHRAASPGALIAGIAAFAFVVICGIWIAIEAITHEDRAAKVEEVKRENANLARAFEEHTVRTLAYIDEFLILLTRQYEAEGASMDLARAFRDYRGASRLMRNAVITDATGLVVLGSHDAPRISQIGRAHV